MTNKQKTKKAERTYLADLKKMKMSQLKEKDDRPLAGRIRDAMEKFKSIENKAGFGEFIASDVGCNVGSVYHFNVIRKGGIAEFVDAVCEGVPFRGKVYTLHSAYSFILKQRKKKISPSDRTPGIFRGLVKKLFYN